MIIFVIPAHNEEDNIESLLMNLDEKMKALNMKYHTIMVDDGSTDSTKERILRYEKKIPLEVIDNGNNKGVGNCFKSGFFRALELAKDDDIIVTKEADNTSYLDTLDVMLQKIGSGDDVVLASCFAPGGKVIGVPLIKLILSLTINYALRFIAPIKGIHTYSSFYRAYKQRILRRAIYAYEGRLIEDRGFSCMVEVLIKLSRLPIRITETPTILQYCKRVGKSKMKVSKTILGYFVLLKNNMFYGKRRRDAILARFGEYGG